MHFEPSQGRAEIWRIPSLCFFSLAQKCFPSICDGNAECHLRRVTLRTHPRSAPFPSLEPVPSCCPCRLGTSVA